MAAKILKLSDYRAAVGSDDEIDLTTAVDAAIRDLQEIIANWSSAAALQRTHECEVMLRRAFLHSLAS